MAPEEYYPGKTLLWTSKGAVYGRQDAPRDRQDHLASQMTKRGFRRMKSDGHMCVHEESFVIALAHMGDLMAFGKPDDAKKVFQELHKCFFLKETGTLKDHGNKVRCLGRILERGGETIHLRGQGVSHEPSEGVPDASLQRGSGTSGAPHHFNTSSEKQSGSSSGRYASGQGRPPQSRNWPDP